MLIQEYLKTDVTGSEPGQDPDFYRRFFDTAMYGLTNNLELLETSYKLYVNICRQKGVILSRKQITGFDLLDGVLTDVAF
ncbi:hypothetical protein [Sporomusa aerivorans]|uniref:hypothetical protein n=1 Tax=Sporomusa aerivorans TaxID=204936 RepID=UPI00352AB6ED